MLSSFKTELYKDLFISFSFWITTLCYLSLIYSILLCLLQTITTTIFFFRTLSVDCEDVIQCNIHPGPGLYKL